MPKASERLTYSVFPYEGMIKRGWVNVYFSRRRGQPTHRFGPSSNSREESIRRAGDAGVARPVYRIKVTPKPPSMRMDPLLHERQSVAEEWFSVHQWKVGGRYSLHLGYGRGVADAQLSRIRNEPRPPLYVIRVKPSAAYLEWLGRGRPRKASAIDAIADAMMPTLPKAGG